MQTENSPPRNLWQKLELMDRRIIFLLVGASIFFPLLLGINFSVTQTKPVEDFYNAIEAIPEGSPVLISADWDPGSLAELYPMTLAVLRHCFDRKLRPVVLTLWPTGVAVVQRTLEETAGPRGLVNGEDYVFLGFKEGRQAVMVAMGQSIPATFPNDYRNITLSEIPLMEGIQNYNSFPIFISISAGFPGTKEYVQQVQSRYGLNMLSACAGVSAPEYYPYYTAGQLTGLIGGLKAAAEYEELIGHKDRATKAMGAQSFGHFMIVALIIFGNVMYFMGRRKS